jgi:hypothetical protein
MPTAGTSITGAEGDLTDTSEGAGGTAGAGTGVTVSLSGTTAPSNTVIIGSASANLASFVFTASNDGDVKVTTVKVKRTGLSADSDLSSVYLYNGSTRLTDNASVSSGYITWNNASGIFTVTAGTSMTITVRADIAAGASSGSTVGVSFMAASGVTTNGAAVSGSFPINGNLMSLASVSTFATAAFNATTYPATANVDAGEDAYTVWKNTLTVGNRAVNLSSIRIRQIGSVLSGDLTGFEFFVDGVKKGESTMVDNYVYFTFDTPIELETGSRILEMRANIISGSTRTFSFSVQYATDFIVADSEYGANVKATAVPATTGTQTVTSGSLTVTKATDSPSGNVTADASNVTLAKYEFKAYGEPIKIEYVRAMVTTNDGSTQEYRNGNLYANGVQVGSTADLNTNNGTPAYTDYSLGSSMVVTPGTPVVLEVRADIYDSDGTNNVTSGDTLAVTIQTYTNGAQRMNSLSYFNAPSANVPANTVTVAVGSMTLAKKGTYGNQTTTIPQTAYKLGEFTLSGNSTEAVNLNTIVLGSTASGTFSYADLKDAYLMYGDKTSSVKATLSASSSWSINYDLGVNETITIGVYANIESGAITNSDSIYTIVQVSGITSESSETVYSSAAGQTIVAGTGSIAVAKAGGSASSKNVKAGSTVDVASYKFTTSYDAYTITEMVVTFPASAGTVIGSAVLMDGTTQLASKSLSGTTATFSGLAIPVPADTSKTIDVKVVLGSVGTGAGTTGADLTATLASYKADNSQGTETSATPSTAGNAIYVYKSLPTISKESLPTQLISSGVQTVAKFTVTGDGAVAWKNIVFTYAMNSVSTSSKPTIYDADTNEQVAGTATQIGNTSGTIVFSATSEQEVSGSKTYIMKWTLTGADSSGDSVSINVARPSVHEASAAAASVTDGAAGTPSFVWSDMSASSHTTLTADWTNDAYLKNLPSDSWTMTR